MSSLAGPSATPPASPQLGGGVGADIAMQNVPSFAQTPVGTVLFPEQKTRARFVKISREEVESDVAVAAFVQQVIMGDNFIDSAKTPKVLISVTGGAGNYVIPKQIEQMFHKGLLKMAEATNAWIVTGGTNSGVMKAVGEAFRDSTIDDVPCIGIASLNALNNYPIFDPNQKVVTFVPNSEAPNAPTLSPYHSHFILVDGTSWNATHNRKDEFGHEIQFRTGMEARFCSKEVNNIPVLLLVVGGGPGTLKTVYEGVRQQFPVVVIDTSGGVADAISDRINAVKEPEKIRTRGDVFQDWAVKNKATPEHYNYMKLIEENAHLVRIFNPRTETKLDVALFESIFEYKNYGRFVDRLKLAITCDQLEVTNSLIASEASGQAEHVKIGLQVACEANRYNIFDSLVQQSADRVVNIQGLYGNIFQKRRWERFYPLLSRGTIDAIEGFVKDKGGNKGKGIHFAAAEENPKDDGEALLLNEKSVEVPVNLMKNFLTDVFYKSGRMYDHYIDTIFLKTHVINDTHATFKGMPNEKLDKKKLPKLTDVLIWALMMGYTELAKKVWRHTALPMHTALAASHFCKFFAKKLANERFVYDDLAVEFEGYALDVLKKLSYKEAKEALDYRYDEFDLNLVELADLGGTQEFTSHPHIQRYVDELLYKNEFGEIPVSTSNWKIFLCIIPIFMFFVYQPYNEDPSLLKKNGKKNGTPDGVAVEKKNSVFNFYSIPLVKFMSNTMCYLGFLVLCSVVLCQEDYGKFTISGQEIFLFVWVFALLIEELAQLREDGFKQYLHRFSNRIDIFMLTLFLVFFALRVAALYLQHDDILAAAVDVFAIATIFAYLRLLHVFSFSSSLGPLYFVIVRLIDDVLRWLFVFILFCVGFQLAVVAFVNQINPDKTADGQKPDPLSPITDGGTFAVAFFTIIGDYGDAIDPLSPNVFGVIVLVIYALIAQIVLVNLLIAMMGDTFGSVKENSDKEWKYTRYSMATEYSSTSAIAPPFNLIITPIRALIKAMSGRSDVSYQTQASREERGSAARRMKSLFKKILDDLAEEQDEEEQKRVENIGAVLQSRITEMSTSTSEAFEKLISKPALTPATSTIGIDPELVLAAARAAATQVQADIEKMISSRLAAVAPPASTAAVAVQHDAKGGSLPLEVQGRRIEVSWDEGVKQEHVQMALSSFAPFEHWCKQMSKGDAKEILELQELVFQSIDTTPRGVLFAKFRTKILHKKSGKQVPGIVFMRGGAVGILVILKLDDPTSALHGKEYTVLTIQTRVPAADAMFPEIPAGMLDGSGHFVGVAAKELEEETGIKIEEDQLIDLTSQFRDKQYQGIYPSAGGCDEFLRLFAYRRKVSSSELAQLQGKATGVIEEGEVITLKVVPLSSLWQEAPDAKALSALYLYRHFMEIGKIPTDY